MRYTGTGGGGWGGGEGCLGQFKTDDEVIGHKFYYNQVAQAQVHKERWMTLATVIHDKNQIKNQPQNIHTPHIHMILYTHTHTVTLN